MRERLALIRHLPPQTVARRACGLLARRSAAVLARRRDLRCSAYCEDAPDGALRRLTSAVPLDPIRMAADWVAPAAALYLEHRFDVLGSGWVEIAYGISSRGLDGIRFPPGPRVEADGEGAWLASRLPTASLAASRRIWRLIEPRYQPIDWQLDCKSGFRWRENQWAGDTPVGHQPGVDVKLPWELARMQHLAVLAWAYALAATGEAGFAPAPRYAAEFRNEILDFIATNPPRFGVNWRCAMDVAIRAANWVVAHDLFRGFGAEFDIEFEAVLKASLVDHGRHILANLEIYPEGRGNHYLADICGLAFIAAALPAGAEADAWLAFAAQELCDETERQFGPDGAGFEGSTSYHRLAGEMVVFTTALLQGLGDERRAALRAADPALLRTRPRRRLRPRGRLPDAAHSARIAGMAEFSRALIKPNGRIVQTGDNDSGRFLKLHPVFERRRTDEAVRLYANLEGYDGLPPDAAYLDEAVLDHRPFIAAAAALIGRADLTAFAGPGWLDAAFVAALAGAPSGSPEPSARIIATPAAASGGDPAPCRTVEIVAAGGDLRAGLAREAFPDFGLWIFRSDRLFLALRCGKLGSGGRGAHDHNDQLAIELAIDGIDWAADPGSYLYTANRALRNAYRSVAAHCAPRWGTREPARLYLGDFWLGDEAQARCLAFSETEFLGEHRGFGRLVRRHVAIGAEAITIRDCGLPFDGEPLLRCAGREAFLARFPAALPFSPGYGKRHREPGPPP